MANEFKHKDVGAQLTSLEFHATDAHEADSQVANDMLYYNGTTWIRATPATIRGTVLRHEVTMIINDFVYPAPGVDWSPIITGAHLGNNKVAKVVGMRLSHLKIGDIIKSYTLQGDAIIAGASSLDCRLIRVNLADPLTTTNIANGAIVQITADGNFSAACNPDDETVVNEKQYALIITATTDAADEFDVMGIELVVETEA